MLEVKNLKYAWPEAAFEFNLDLAEGTTAILRGASGVGKSTLLALIAGLLTPQSGSIAWRGQDITPLPPAARPLSLLFQDGNLFPHLDCAANIGLGIHPALKIDAAGWRAVEDSMQSLGIGGMGRRMPATLSGGQQQRVALARVLLRARLRGGALLLLDEPFAALDDKTRKECIGFTRRIIREENLTALVVSHDAGDARRMGAGRVITLRGRKRQR